MLPFVVHWGDVARWPVIFAPLLVGGVMIRLLQRQRMSGRGVDQCALGVIHCVGDTRGLSMDLLPQVLIPLLILGGFVYLFTRRNRERDRNAPLRGEIEARVCFETALARVSILGTGGFWAPRRVDFGARAKAADRRH
jgi:hypothetical protein